MGPPGQGIASAALRLLLRGALLAAAMGLVPAVVADSADAGSAPEYRVYPIGWVRKQAGHTTIVVEPRFREALLGVEDLSHLWVLYWFDRNDTPEQRAILQVHPRRDPNNPIRGVFATRAPVRPNLIAMTRVRVLAVRDNVIEIDGIDAFPDTPVLDLKP